MVPIAVGGKVIFMPPLYISLVIIHTNKQGGMKMTLPPMARYQRFSSEAVPASTRLTIALADSQALDGKPSRDEFRARIYGLASGSVYYEAPVGVPVNRSGVHVGVGVGATLTPPCPAYFSSDSPYKICRAASE